MALCKCGCGKEAKPGRVYRKAHHWRGVIRSKYKGTAVVVATTGDTVTIAVRNKHVMVDRDVLAWLDLAQLSLNYSGRYAYATYKNEPLHRIIAKTPEALHTDHINRNTLDNRRANLRICTPAQNARNAKPPHPTSSQYKGVYFDSGRKKWGAAIRYAGRVRWIGRYRSEADAACAYNHAASKLQGEFAYLNEVDCRGKENLAERFLRSVENQNR